MDNGFHFRWDIFFSAIFQPDRQILMGLSLTVGISVMAMLLGIVLGSLLALAQISANGILRRAAWLYVWGLSRHSPSGPTDDHFFRIWCFENLHLAGHLRSAAWSFPAMCKQGQLLSVSMRLPIWRRSSELASCRWQRAERGSQSTRNDLSACDAPHCNAAGVACDRPGYGQQLQRNAQGNVASRGHQCPRNCLLYLHTKTAAGPGLPSV